MKLFTIFSDGHKEEWCDTDKLPDWRKEEVPDVTPDAMPTDAQSVDHGPWTMFANLFGWVSEEHNK